MNSLGKIIKNYSGPALSPAFNLPTHIINDPRWKELVDLLNKKNGFYGFESSLWVLPLGDNKNLSIEKWNHLELWKRSYKYLKLEKMTCFGCNIFGDQFFFDSEGFGQMDAESGEIERLGDNLSEWAESILKDPSYHLGSVIAHDWQVCNGPLQLGERLVPKKPFVLGGEFEIENLVSMNFVQAMILRGEIATQLHDVPDGSTIIINNE